MVSNRVVRAVPSHNWTLVRYLQNNSHWNCTFGNWDLIQVSLKTANINV